VLRDPRFGLLVLAVGVVLLLTGAVGLALTPATREAAAPGPSPSPSPVGSPTEEPAEQRAETVEAFVASFNRAQEDENARFLLARLHPEVLQRYGKGQCRAYLREVAGTVGDVEVRRASELGRAEYSTDGQTVTVSDAYTLRIAFTANGEPVRGRMTLALVDDRLRWFSDCGDPV
jgi:hypothetical protein